MTTPPDATHTQRWNEGGRASYRPAREVIDPLRYDVHQLSKDKDAKAFIERYHYAASFPAARRRFGLYDGVRLVGVAVYSQPMSDGVFSPYFAAPPAECLELGRLVLLDEVPANAETWFLARTFKALKREGFAGILSFSDPVPRSSASGEAMFRGHVGFCYQAGNAHYLGRSSARTLRLLPNGSVLSARAISKIRAQDTGHVYATQQLVSAGAPPPSPNEDPREWLARVLPVITRPLKHAGNHRYGWAFNKKVWMPSVTRGAYPKTLEAV